MTWFVFFASLAASFAAGADDHRTPAGWARQPVVVGSYSIAVPPQVRGGPVQGIDSQVAEYRGPGFRLSFDFGMYGGRPDCRAQQCSTTEIDGLPATLARGEQRPSAGAAGMTRWVH